MKMIYTTIRKWFQNTEKPYKIEWIMLFTAMILFTLSFTYDDIMITTRHSIRFWDVLFQGKPWEFYNYNYSGHPTNNSANYDFTVYLIFAVWDFPLWAAERLLQIDATENIFCLMWAKLQLLLAILLTAKMLMALGKELKMSKNTRLWLAFVWLSSVLLCTSTLIMSQYDIFTVFFMLCGFNAYLKGNNKKFLLFFAMAVSCKYFALLVFLPLLLLRYKNVFRIFACVLSSLSISMFWKILFAAFTNRVEGVALIDSLLPKFYSWNINAGLYSASVFVMSMMALCIWAYAKEKDEENIAQNAVFAASAAMIAFAAESPLHPYWVVLATPFLSLLLFMNAERFGLNVFLEIVFSVALVVQQMVYYNWCFSNSVVSPMLFGALLGTNLDIHEGIGDFMKFLDTVFPLLITASSMMLCSAAALLIFNRPNKLVSQKGKEPLIDRSVIWLRYAAFVCIGLLPIAYYIHNCH